MKAPSWDVRLQCLTETIGAPSPLQAATHMQVRLHLVVHVSRSSSVQIERQLLLHSRLTSLCVLCTGLAFDLSTSIGRCQTTWAFLHIDDQMESVLGGAGEFTGSSAAATTFAHDPQEYLYGGIGMVGLSAI